MMMLETICFLGRSEGMGNFQLRMLVKWEESDGICTAEKEESRHSLKVSLWLSSYKVVTIVKQGIKA